MENNQNYTAGLERLNQLNAEAVPKMLALGDLGRYVIEFGFGEIFERGSLNLREREMLTIAILTVLGSREPQLKLHIQAGLKIGIEPKVIEEVIIQTVPYAGFPTAMNAMRLFNGVVADLGSKQDVEVTE